MDNIIQGNKPIIFWIDKNIKSPENIQYLRKLGYNFIQINHGYNFSLEDISISNNENNECSIHPFEDITQAIISLKQIKFKATIIIVSGSCFVDFIKELHKNINDIYVIPKIIVFTSKNKSPSIPNEIASNEKFYTCGGIKTAFSDIQIFIKKIQNKFLSYPTSNQPTSKSIIGEKLIFEQVRKMEELVLPMLYRTYLEESNTKENNKFIEFLCSEYIKETNYKDILNQISGVEDIPVELLSKYYARLYTIEGNFYKDMKTDLLEGNEENLKKYQPFIKTLFEGSEVGALKPFIGDKLYSAQFLSQKEIDDLMSYNKYKIPNLPSSIVFSKSFISFTKDEKVAKNFYLNYNKNAILTVVRYEKDKNLNTHADIEELSSIPNEREVLFFPFSTFGIEDFNYDENLHGYNLRLIYLGRYIEEFEKNKKLFNSNETVPNTKFKSLFKNSGLVKNDKVNNFNNIKINEVSNQYESYKYSKTEKCNKCFWWFLALLGLLGLIALIKKSKDENCDKNYYLDKSDSKCLPCSSGYYSNSGSSYCSRCPYGQSSYGNGTDCFNCPAGTISNYYYEECATCIAGYYSKEGSTSCNKCPGGTYSGLKSEKCLNCSAGYYSQSGSAECKLCKEGTYSIEGSANCKVFPSGTYSNISGASSCIKCPAGTSPNNKRIACDECKEGYYANVSGTEECKKCPAGYFSYRKGAIFCNKCPAGMTSNNARTSCNNCSKGYYSGIAGSGECSKCPGGTYSDEEGLTSCKICPAGTISNYYRTACDTCSEGYYSNKTGAIECIQCPVGSITNKKGSTNCSICPAGTYEYLRKYCEKCSRGKYSNITGATGCIQCPAGTYNTKDGSTNCSICPAGTYEYLRKYCEKCQSGYCSEQGSTSCYKCS